MRTSTLKPSGASYPLRRYVSSLTRMLPRSSCVASLSRAHRRVGPRRCDASEVRWATRERYEVDGLGDEVERSVR